MYAFPPWSMIPLVLKKLQSSSGVLMTLVAPFWPQRPWYLDLRDLVVDGPICLPVSVDLFRRSLSLSSSRDPQAVPSCLETIKQFTKYKGFSSRVVTQIGFAHRSSSRAVYQARWLVYRRWCGIENPSIFHRTLPKIAGFLLWLRTSKNISVSAIVGYRSMLSVFRFKLPDISSFPVLHDVLRLFKAEAPIRSAHPHLNRYLLYLCAPCLRKFCLFCP